MQSKQRQSQLPEDRISGTETILFMRKESNGHPGLCLTALLPRLKSRVSVLSEFMKKNKVKMFIFLAVMCAVCAGINLANHNYALAALCACACALDLYNAWLK